MWCKIMVKIYNFNRKCLEFKFLISEGSHFVIKIYWHGRLKKKVLHMGKYFYDLTQIMKSNDAF